MDPVHTLSQSPWESPETFMFSLSSIRDDPPPNATGFRLNTPAIAAAPPVSVQPSLAGPIRLKRRRLASPQRPSRSPHPIYSSNHPEVLDLLSECSSSPLEACPITSQRPRWVLVVAALSVYSHPSYPAHLAFWRPDIMNETAEMIDEFLKTREAKYLESRKGWVDSEISLYTLRGHQRGYHPDLYSPNQSTRTLRKRKAGMIATRGDLDLDGILEDDEDGSRKRARRTTRRSNPTRKKAAVSHEVQSPDSTLTTPEDTSTLDDDTSLSPPPVSMKTRSSGRALPEEEGPLVDPLPLLAAPTYKKHRRRSSSMTSSGVSLSSSTLTADTLVENEDDARSVITVDTIVDRKVAGHAEADDSIVALEKLALLVDVAAASEFSSSSPLSILSVTPPPSPRRSSRTIQRPKRARDMEEEVPSVRPRTRLASTSAPPASTAKRKSRQKKV